MFCLVLYFVIWWSSLLPALCIPVPVSVSVCPLYLCLCLCGSLSLGAHTHTHTHTHACARAHAHMQTHKHMHSVTHTKQTHGCTTVIILAVFRYKSTRELKLSQIDKNILKLKMWFQWFESGFDVQFDQSRCCIASYWERF